MIPLTIILLIVLAYFLGAIPFAYIIVRLVKGVDIRTVGSGNAGATNAARVLGKWGFISVFILDLLKGFIPTFIAVDCFGSSWVPLVVGLAAVLGHTYTVFLRFKGGKGVATAAGVFIALAPVPTSIALIVFIIVFLITRMVSAGSIIAAVTLFIAVLFISDWTLLKIFTGFLAAFVIFKHRANIGRIIRGEENKFERKPKK